MQPLHRLNSSRNGSVSNGCNKPLVAWCRRWTWHVDTCCVTRPEGCIFKSRASCTPGRSVEGHGFHGRRVRSLRKHHLRWTWWNEELQHFSVSSNFARSKVTKFRQAWTCTGSIEIFVKVCSSSAAAATTAVWCLVNITLSCRAQCVARLQACLDTLVPCIIPRNSINSLHSLESIILKKQSFNPNSWGNRQQQCSGTAPNSSNGCRQECSFAECSVECNAKSQKHSNFVLKHTKKLWNVLML